MMKTFALSTLTLALVFAVQFRTQAQEPPQPTEEHQALKQDVGTWDAVMKMYFEGPDSEPMEVKAVETNTMMGEFWLISKLEYEMFGMKLHGRGQFGYDPARKKFTGTWCDSSMPYMSTMEGEWDESSKSWTYAMKGYDEAGNPTAGKLITTIKDDDHKTFTMYMGVPGEKDDYVKFMEVDYTRRK